MNEQGGSYDPEEEDDDLSEDDIPESIVLKWIADGAATLGEVAQALRACADLFERYERDGWQLSEAVDGGWCHLEHATLKALPQYEREL